MNIRIELPEVLFVIASALFIAGLSGIGWTFFGLANVVGICRFGLNQAEKIEEVKQRSKLEEEIKTLLDDEDLSGSSDTFPKLVH